MEPDFAERFAKLHLDYCRTCVTILDALWHLRIPIRSPRPVVNKRTSHTHVCSHKCSWCGPNGRRPQ